ncbi:Chemotaxis protein CheY [Rubripirellula tenax]|uniref:Chemotaxis protein CheY n=1 Tax=Rubripirellula tenax TaxID=2528015 RepID=A0A5C6FIL1_9BACT|nr:response regulator [Rubripirellula tenax]TWU59889.1 Chemotaxis protein CheY [Rubripirellula tenax]
MSDSGRTVLIAEDDPVFRRVLSFTIGRGGFVVETASDGEAAYQRICQGGIGFLVTDHQMPGCSGIELLERIAIHPDAIAIPTILCTAKGFELDTIAIQRKYHLVDVLNKPFSPRRLEELIVKHLGVSPSTPNAAESAVGSWSHG